MEEPLVCELYYSLSRPLPEGGARNRLVRLKTSPLPSGPGVLAEDPLPGDQRQELWQCGEGLPHHGL